MKKLVILLILLTGCGNSTYNALEEAETLQVRGHQWLQFRDGDAGRMMILHDPDCPCGRK